MGSTVKVEGKANDAFAMLTALNLWEHRENASLNDLTKYLVQKSSNNETLSDLRSLMDNGAQIGLILSERLINAPSEIAPPMYSMLLDEIDAAVEDKEPYEFTHYLVLSKTYQEVESVLDQESERKSKKGKSNSPLLHFHPEDEVLQIYARGFGSFPYTKGDESAADSKRAFQEMGVKSQGHLILIESAKFRAAVQAVNEYLQPSQ